MLTLCGFISLRVGICGNHEQNNPFGKYIIANNLRIKYKKKRLHSQVALPPSITVYPPIYPHAKTSGYSHPSNQKISKGYTFKPPLFYPPFFQPLFHIQNIFMQAKVSTSFCMIVFMQYVQSCFIAIAPLFISLLKLNNVRFPFCINKLATFYKMLEVKLILQIPFAQKKKKKHSKRLLFNPLVSSNLETTFRRP